MKILVTIGVRGGSKGVKGKNIRPLLGKPLIAYTIDQAKAWGKADRVVVTTDSPEIAAIARDCGAEVPFMRPAELATDHAGKLPVIRHALVECERIFKTTYDVVVDLDATSPLRKAHDLDRCLELFESRKATTLFSAVRAHKNPYFNMVEVDSTGNAVLCKTLPNGVQRRQDAPDVYAMNASIYFYRRAFLLDGKSETPFSDRSVVYEMDELSAFDIDREVDFKVIELFLKEGFFRF